MSEEQKPNLDANPNINYNFDPNKEYSEALKIWHKETSQDFFAFVKVGNNLAAIKMLPLLLKKSFNRIEHELVERPSKDSTNDASHLFFSILSPLPNVFELLNDKEKFVDPEKEQIRVALEEHVGRVVAKYPDQATMLENEWMNSTTVNRGGIVNLRDMLRDSGDADGIYNPFDSLRGK